jgi:hypothetical protein
LSSRTCLAEARSEAAPPRSPCPPFHLLEGPGLSGTTRQLPWSWVPSLRPRQVGRGHTGPWHSACATGVPPQGRAAATVVAGGASQRSPGPHPVVQHSSAILLPLSTLATGAWRCSSSAVTTPCAPLADCHEQWLVGSEPRCHGLGVIVPAPPARVGQVGHLAVATNPDGACSYSPELDHDFAVRAMWYRYQTAAGSGTPLGVEIAWQASCAEPT